MRYRVECRFGDVGVAYIEAEDRAEAWRKARELDGGEFLIDEKANMGNGEIISVVELCPDDCTDCRPNEHVASFDDGFCCCTVGTGGHCPECHR